MSAKQIRLNDVGTRFLITVKEEGSVVNISGATTLVMYWYKPSGTVVEKTPAFYTDGVDGKVYYDTITGDLDEAGIWKYQLKIVTATGSWKTDIQTFQVYRNLS